jgi:glycosyltransferase involved in cell wall biosynthesis
MEKTIRVLYDYQTFHAQRFGGISRYFCEIARHASNVEPLTAVRFSMNQYIRHSDIKGHTPIPMRPYKIMSGMFRNINRKASLQALNRGDFDLFHPTYYNPYFLDALKEKPFVLTIHDMTHERFPQYFVGDPTPSYKKLLAAKAKRIIAISECTKRDIMEHLDVPEEKIDVIYHGLDPQPLAEGRPAGLPDEYILYVGDRRGYKNFELTVEGFARLAQSHPDMHLVLTGRRLSKGEKELLLRHGVAQRVTLMSDISDTVLSQLYRNARLFVYPSLYEGFGIPILEAFAQQCPVVLSRASCFPEVAADAAEYFDAHSVDEMVAAMEHVLSDADYRRRLTEKGAERLHLFTWEETARRTEQTYMKALTDMA